MKGWGSTPPSDAASPGKVVSAKSHNVQQSFAKLLSAVRSVPAALPAASEASPHAQVFNTAPCASPPTQSPSEPAPPPVVRVGALTCLRVDPTVDPKDTPQHRCLCSHFISFTLFALVALLSALLWTLQPGLCSSSSLFLSSLASNEIGKALLDITW